MKRRIQRFFLFVIMIFLITGCGLESVEQKETALGRYVEETVELPVQNVTCISLVQKDSFIRLVDFNGQDLVSTDGGKSFDKIENLSDEYENDITPVLLSMAENADGDRILTTFLELNSYTHMVFTKNEQSIMLDKFSTMDFLSLFVSRDGSFIALQDKNVYWIDSTTGECQFLFESQGYPYYAASDEKMLYVADESGIWIYDLESSELKQQDTLLNDLTIKEAGDFLLYPYGEEVYILTREGLYLYELYSESKTRLIDGSLCSIGDITKNYVGMAVIETGNNAEFLIYYSDGSLLRYVYDSTLSSEPESVLRVYGVYEDGNVRQLINAFQKEHPEISVKYEIGIDSDNGMTLDDALKNLSTEIAAGSGPDILLMDYLPYESYMGKGALMELEEIRNAIDESEYFINVVDGVRTESGLYTIPLTFTIPVIGGDASILGIDTLSELADLLESERKEKPEGSLFSFVDAKGALKLLSQSSMGVWVQEDGTLDRKMVEDFLIQVKRIYDAQMAGFPNEEPQLQYTSWNWGTGENLFVRYFDSYGVRDAAEDAILEFPGQPFYAGYLSNSKDDFPYFMGQLKYLEEDYTLMPGQNYGTVLVSTLLSICNTSGNKEEATLFVEYAFSEEFQSAAFLNGIPINRSAHSNREICPHDTRMVYSMLIYPLQEGVDEIIEIYWPTDLDFYLLNAKIENISGVNYCDTRVYEAVIKYGEAALQGEISIEEAMNTIEKSVQLYLAE
ncbi:MAG: carbohydrate ABC transporter substrate-binding protein [Lachnospiraceae bacterium]|nr:carbohydrate ABC transporter substrate-binding protein [Lachnospiraceae bacterium]